STPMAWAMMTWPLRRDDEPGHRFSRPRHPLYDLLGVRYVMTEPGVVLPFKLAFQDPAGWIYERPWWLPRLFLPERAVAYRGGAWWDWLEANRDFAKRSLVQSIPGQGDLWRAGRPRQSDLALALLEPEHVRARVRLAETRLLASSIFQDGHWHVLAGGKRQRAVLADGPLVGVWLPAGEQRVDLVYRPELFVTGCAFAALSLAAAAICWVPRPRPTPRRL
ncbi:MAG TPA: hypothetical protein VFC23_16705, partial [Thermoanaerobaculia bacterium]|nr:hypothetical protein [Thermoanaerobaculia bacterium]